MHRARNRMYYLRTQKGPVVSLFMDKKNEKQGEEQIRVHGKMHQAKGLNISYTLIS